MAKLKGVRRKNKDKPWIGDGLRRQMKRRKTATVFYNKETKRGVNIGNDWTELFRNPSKQVQPIAEETAGRRGKELAISKFLGLDEANQSSWSEIWATIARELTETFLLCYEWVRERARSKWLEQSAVAVRAKAGSSWQKSRGTASAEKCTGGKRALLRTF